VYWTPVVSLYPHRYCIAEEKLLIVQNTIAGGEIYFFICPHPYFIRRKAIKESGEGYTRTCDNKSFRIRIKWELVGPWSRKKILLLVCSSVRYVSLPCCLFVVTTPRMKSLACQPADSGTKGHFAFYLSEEQFYFAALCKMTLLANWKFIGHFEIAMGAITTPG
jgi:hypothetical protein